MNPLKTCSRCTKILSLENFYKSKTSYDGLIGHCKVCCKSLQDKWKERNPGRYREYYMKYRQENYVKVRAGEIRSKFAHREERLKKMRDYNSKIRLEILEIYGNKCACCGDLNKEFFALDHIQGGGTKEKKTLGTRVLYKKIKEEGYPKDKYQILCHNCNMSLGFYGYCPHRPDLKRPLHKNSPRKF